jgi:hypothetical protein
MKELEKKVIQDLIKFYEFYLKSEDEEIIKEKAEQIYGPYIQATTLLSNEIIGFIASLVNICVPTGFLPPTKEEAKKILKKLKKLQKELEQ